MQSTNTTINASPPIPSTQNTSTIQRQVTPPLQPSSIPIFQFAQTVRMDNEEDPEQAGELTTEGSTDSRFVMKSLYPGMKQGELTLTSPMRRVVRLCEKGGFIRRYGREEWRWIPYIVIDDYKVYYDKSGRFRVGDAYMKVLTIRYKGQLYPIEIVSLVGQRM